MVTAALGVLGALAAWESGNTLPAADKEQHGTSRSVPHNAS